jgi:hypothetical protein
MRPLYLGIAFLLCFCFSFFFPPEPESVEAGIEPRVYNDLRLYATYSSAVYRRECPKPLGNLLIQKVCSFFLIGDKNLIGAPSSIEVSWCKRSVCFSSWEQDWNQQYLSSRALFQYVFSCDSGLIKLHCMCRWNPKYHARVPWLCSLVCIPF